MLDIYRVHDQEILDNGFYAWWCSEKHFGYCLRQFLAVPHVYCLIQYIENILDIKFFKFLHKWQCVHVRMSCENKKYVLEKYMQQSTSPTEGKFLAVKIAGKISLVGMGS